MENNNELQTVISEYLLIYYQSSNSQVLQTDDLQKQNPQKKKLLWKNKGKGTNGRKEKNRKKLRSKKPV